MKKNITVFVLYYILLIGIALFVRDIPNQYASIGLTELTVEKIIQLSEFGDPASYGHGAIDVASTGWITKEHQVVFNAWPPGFTLLEAFIIKVLGIGAPIVLVLQLLLGALFAAVLTMLYNTWRFIKNDLISFLFPLSIFAFPLSRVYLLQPIGVSFGEPFAVAFFALGFLFLCKASKNCQVKFAIYAGFLFALSAYFRSQFEIFVLAMSLLGIVSLIILRNKPAWSDQYFSFRNMILTVVIVSNLLMMPWRLYHLVNHGFPVWVSTPLATAKIAVQTDEALKASGRGFILAGGGNLACKVDPKICGKTDETTRAFIKAYLTHPLEWYQLKLKLLPKYWFASIGNWVTVEIPSSLFDYFVNSIFIGMFIFSVLVLSFGEFKKTLIGNSISWILYSLIFSYSLIYSLVHFEARYFYFPKFIICIIFAVTLSKYLEYASKD